MQSEYGVWATVIAQLPLISCFSFHQVECAIMRERAQLAMQTEWLYLIIGSIYIAQSISMDKLV